MRSRYEPAGAAGLKALSQSRAAVQDDCNLSGALMAYHNTVACPLPPNSMPAVHHGVDCACCATATASQNLDEVAFSRSAAAAAQSGDYFRLKSVIERQPAQLHDDGYQGEYLRLHASV